MPRLLLAVCVAVLVASPALRADTLVRRDGTREEGTLVSVDPSKVVIRTGRGEISVPRSDVASVTFGSSPSAPPFKVEVRHVRSDDALDLWLDDRAVIREAREGGSWIDLTPWLKDGNNPLRLRIRNDRGTWAYRFLLRIDGEVQTFSCGTPLRSDDPCTCCGKTGRETGVIDDLPVIWIHVDRALGRAEVIP